MLILELSSRSHKLLNLTVFVVKGSGGVMAALSAGDRKCYVFETRWHIANPWGERSARSSKDPMQPSIPGNHVWGLKE